jgi:hypothetical protein
MDLNLLPLGIAFDFRGIYLSEPGLYAVVRKFRSEPEHSTRLTEEGDEGVGEFVQWGELKDVFLS